LWFFHCLVSQECENLNKTLVAAKLLRCFAKFHSAPVSIFGHGDMAMSDEHLRKIAKKVRDFD
jgi:hypothetical protein